MNFKKIAACMVMASFIATFGLAKSAHAVTLNSSADVQQTLTVTAVTALNFGSFATDGTASLVQFDAGTSIATSTPSNTTLLGGEVGGVVSINAPSIGTATVTTVATDLTGPGTAMPMAATCLGVGGALGTPDGSCSFTTVVGVQNIDVGGVLTVNAGQTAGAYTGTIDVTANFQ